MHAVYSTLLNMAISDQWLVTANLILSALLALWMLRYRWLYLNSREQQENSRDLIDNLSEGIYRSTLDGRILSSNMALARLNGCDSPAELLAGVDDIAARWYVEPCRRDEFRQILMLDGHVKDFVSEVYRYKTRERIWVSESARLVRDKKTGKPLYCEGSVREITETVKRLKLEELYQKLTNHVPGGLFQIVRNKGGQFALPYASSGFRDIAAITEEMAHPEAFVERIHSEDREFFVGSLRRSGVALERWDCEFRAVDLLGKFKWLRVTATPEAVDDGVIWHGYVADISRRKENEMAIAHLAYNDPLTDLPNRRMILERVNAATKRCARQNTYAALLFLDIDNFKQLNDSHGHHVGDTFLKLVAERLRSCVRTEDVVARIGGDEFVVLIEDVGQQHAAVVEKAVMTAQRLLSSLRQAYEIGELRYAASASVGIVVFDGSEQSTDDILKKADIAMYRVKAAGRDGLALFDMGPVESDDRIPRGEEVEGVPTGESRLRA